jgi:hypothetical protein
LIAVAWSGTTRKADRKASASGEVPVVFPAGNVDGRRRADKTVELSSAIGHCTRETFRRVGGRHTP